MKIQMRHAVVSLLVAAMSASLPAMSKQSVSVVNNQEKTVLSTEKEKVSYAIGLDIARSHVFELIAQDIDVAALQRAIENVFKGGPPLISEEVAQTTDTALRAMLAARSGQQEASGTAPPAVSKENIGLMLGSYMVGPSLLAIKDDIDLPVLLQALRTRFAKRTPLMDEQEMTTRMQAFVASKNAVVAGKIVMRAVLFSLRTRTRRAWSPPLQVFSTWCCGREAAHVRPQVIMCVSTTRASCSAVKCLIALISVVSRPSLVLVR